MLNYIQHALAAHDCLKKQSPTPSLFALLVDDCCHKFFSELSSMVNNEVAFPYPNSSVKDAKNRF